MTSLDGLNWMVEGRSYAWQQMHVMGKLRCRPQELLSLPPIQNPPCHVLSRKNEMKLSQKQWNWGCCKSFITSKIIWISALKNKMLKLCRNLTIKFIIHQYTGASFGEVKYFIEILNFFNKIKFCHEFCNTDFCLSLVIFFVLMYKNFLSQWQSKSK